MNPDVQRTLKLGFRGLRKAGNEYDARWESTFLFGLLFAYNATGLISPETYEKCKKIRTKIFNERLDYFWAVKRGARDKEKAGRELALATQPVEKNTTTIDSIIPN